MTHQELKLLLDYFGDIKVITFKGNFFGDLRALLKIKYKDVLK